MYNNLKKKRIGGSTIRKTISLFWRLIKESNQAFTLSFLNKLYHWVYQRANPGRDGAEIIFISWLIKEEEVIEFYQHCSTTSELMHPDVSHPWLLTSPKTETTTHIQWRQLTTKKKKKKPSLHLLRPFLHPAYYLQEMQRTENDVKSYDVDAVSKILTMGNSLGQMTQFLQTIKSNGGKRQQEQTCGLKRVLNGLSTNCNVQAWWGSWFKKKKNIKNLSFTREVEMGTLNIFLKIRIYC